MRALLFLFGFLPVLSLAAPKIFFENGKPFDRMCGRGFDFGKNDQVADPAKYNEAWSDELDSRMGEFEQEWKKSSPKLFKILKKEFKKDFARKEYSAVLSVCALSPSMPHPLLLNVSRYMKSYWEGKREPKEMKLFVDVPFHELIHIWLAENFPNAKFSEGPSINSHVFLFAVQNLVYEKAGRKDLWTHAHDFALHAGGPHQMAMEIFDREGREKILKELK